MMTESSFWLNYPSYINVQFIDVCLWVRTPKSQKKPSNLMQLGYIKQMAILSHTSALFV